MQNNISRRETIAALAFISAATAVPLGAAALVEGDTIDRTAWDKAFHAYQSAKANRDQFEHVYMAPAEAVFAASLPDGGEGGLVGKGHEYRRRWNAAYDEHIGSLMGGGRRADEVSEELMNAVCDRSMDLHRLAAPDTEALLWKLTELWGNDPTAGYSDWIIEQLLDDARRLLGRRA